MPLLTFAETTAATPPSAPLPADEKTLLARLRAGDRNAAEELVESTYQAVYASLYRLCGGDADLASDLTQDTYQKAWESIDRFEGRARLFTWLYRIAYTTFISHVRRPQRVVPLEEPVRAALRDAAPGADEIMSSAEEGGAVRKAVLELPEDLRFTVTAHFWGGLEVKEIARIEHITTVAIRKRLYKAFSLLERALGSEGR